MSVQETKEQLGAAVQHGGEAYASLETCRENIGAAIEKAQEAGNLCAVAFDGSLSEEASSAQALFVEVESIVRRIHEEITEAQEKLLAAQEHCNTYIGRA